MKAPGAHSAVDVGAIVEPRHHAPAKHGGEAAKFAKAFAETVAQQSNHHAAKKGEQKPGADAVGASHQSTTAADVRRGPLHGAWRDLKDDADPESPVDGSRPGAAVDETSEKEAGTVRATVAEATGPVGNSAVEQIAAALPALLALPDRVGTTDAAQPEAVCVGANADSMALPDRLAVLSSPRFDRSEWDPGHEPAHQAEMVTSLPEVKVIGEEAHLAPSRNIVAPGRSIEATPRSSEASPRNTEIPEKHTVYRLSDQPAQNAEPRSKDRADPIRRGSGESIAAADEIEARDRVVAAAKAQGAGGDLDSATQPALSAPSLQVLDGLLGTSEPKGELANRPPSGAAEPDQKATLTPFVKVIKLQLAPESLGLVNVVVARGETSLRIRLEAETGDTRSALLADRDSISRRLEAGGLRVDELVVMRLADSGNTAPQDMRSATASGWANGSHAGHRSDQGEPRQNGREWRGEPPRDAKPDEVRLAQTDAPPRDGSERFLGRRALRSV